MSFSPHESSDDSSDRANSDLNPYAAPQSRPEAAAPSEGFPRATLFQWLVGLKILTIIGGAIAAHIEIESILVSGSLLTLQGIPIGLLSYRASYWRGLSFGVCGPAISIFCFLLINIMDWGPKDAEEPVSAIADVYAVVAVILGVGTMFLPAVPPHNRFRDLS